MSKTWQGKLIPITPKKRKMAATGRKPNPGRASRRQTYGDTYTHFVGIHTRTKSERKRVRER